MPRIWLSSLALVIACASNSGDGDSRTASVGGESESATSSTMSTTNSDATESSTQDDSSSDDAEEEAETDEAETDEAETDETETGPDPETDTGEPGNSLGVFELTYYWVAYEGDFDPAPTTDVGDCGGQTIATVPTEFADALKLEGSGKLLDGRLLNIGGCGCGGGYDCFIELDPRQFPWGQGSQSNPLMPYLSIATDTAVLSTGTWVYAADLDDQELPDGSTHDGCLRADDVGGGIDGMHIDWFVGLRDNYLTLDPDVPEQLELFEAGTLCP
jgi:hypothetical protein